MTISVDGVRESLRETARVALAPGVEPEWTTSILRGLAKLATPDMCVDPDVSAPARGRGRRANEHLWDLTISSWPNYAQVPYSYPAYYQAAAHPKLLLIAESEWGDQRSRRENGAAVLEDFAKLLAARAPLKVMVFGYHEEKEAGSGSPSSSFTELTTLMAGLICAAEDDADYVLFGVAWKGTEYRDVHVHGRTQSGEHVGP